MRPCECDKEGCRLCWLFNNDKRYRRLWSPPLPVPERTYLINLKRRTDRLEQAQSEFEKIGVKPTLFEAVDALHLPLPEGWNAGAGAFGCRESHRRVLEQCIADGVQSVAIFEDDVTFVHGFAAKLSTFLAEVPDGWDSVMLGGQHISPGELVKSNVVRCLNCHRTHGYILRGRYIRELYRLWSTEAGHIDHVWATHQKDAKVYAPLHWLCGQRSSASDINGRQLGERWWEAKRTLPCSTCKGGTGKVR